MLPYALRGFFAADKKGGLSVRECPKQKTRLTQ